MKFATGILLSAAGLLTASTVGAQTETIRAQGNTPYNINSANDADGSGSIQYQWYRNGQPIASNGQGASYTIPANEAKGTVTYMRRATVNSSCMGEKEGFSNAVTFDFCEGLLLNNVCWAEYHVRDSGEFATSHSYAEVRFYQWNRSGKAWSDTTVNTGWVSSITDLEWTTTPCPSGWRIPTQAEYQDLHNSGSTWVTATQRGAPVPGRFYGSKHADCVFPNNMAGCVFFPASGYRYPTNGAFTGGGASGNSWSSTQGGSANGYFLGFASTFSGPAYSYSKAYGFSVRCVR